MKKIITCFLAAIVLLSGIVVPITARADQEYVFMDFDDINASKGLLLTQVESSGECTQGIGSLKMIPQKPIGNSYNVGAMAFITLPVAENLSSYDTFKIDIYFSREMTGNNTFEVNLITNPDHQDGFDYRVRVDEFEAGWHTLTLNEQTLADTVDGADMKNIQRVRLTWFNYAQIDNVYFYADNLRAIYPDESSQESETVSSFTSVQSTVNKELGYGDINRDYTVDAVDALMVLQYAVNKIQFTSEQKIIADINANEEINANDALVILQYAVEKVNYFSAESTPLSQRLSAISSENASGGSSGGNQSVVDSGAYTADKTADTSFVLTGEGLAKKTMYVMSISSVTSDDHYTRFIYSFQGLLNRDFGYDADHDCVLYVLRDTTDTTWYNYIRGEGKTYNGYTRKAIGSWDIFYSTFEKQIKQCGMILWDPSVPSTANVAATICSLDGYLPVLSGSSLETDLKARGVTQKQSLVNMFTGNGTITGTNQRSSGSAKNDAYRWALEKYFDRCSSKYLAYTLDGACSVEGNIIAQSGNTSINCLSNHDYIIARRCFVYDLYPYKSEAACDEPGQPVGVDNQTMLQIFAARYKRASGDFGQLLGFPPWWQKYSADVGRGSRAATWIEWLFCEYITCYNLAKEADAQHPASMTNGSVYYKYKSTVKKYENTEPTANLTFNSGTHYYTIYIGDYDSSAWLKMHTVNFWMKDTNHGKVDMMWAYNPNLSLRVPMIFDYVYTEKTTHDFFSAGDDGAGYIIPSGLFRGQNLAYSGTPRPNENVDAGQKWADYCKPFYEKFDLDITGFIINGANGIDTRVFDVFNQFATLGSFHNDVSKRLVKYKGVYYVHLQNGIEGGNASTMYSHSFSHMSGYNFSAFRTVCQSPTKILQITNEYESYAAARGQNVRYVDPYTYFNLIKASGQGSVLG